MFDKRDLAKMARRSQARQRARQVPIRQRGDRGFHQYGDPMRCTYGTTIEVYESSSAEGPHVWVTMQEGPNLKGGLASAHLDAKQARTLIGLLRAWLREIPSRWANGGE